MSTKLDKAKKINCIYLSKTFNCNSIFVSDN